MVTGLLRPVLRKQGPRGQLLEEGGRGNELVLRTAVFVGQVSQEGGGGGGSEAPGIRSGKATGIRLCPYTEASDEPRSFLDLGRVLPTFRKSGHERFI